MHTLDTLQTHMKELDNHIFSFKTSMITSKYHDSSHMSELERDMAIQQDQLKTPKKDATLWATKLKKDRQTYYFHDQKTQHIHKLLERKKLRLHLKLPNMEESEQRNTLQLTQGFLQHIFGGISHTSEAWRVGKLI